MTPFSIIIVLAALCARSAFAQCDGPSVTISSTADASTISNCGTYNGDIIIADSASGQIALTGISHLKGDLSCNNATRVTGISFNQLVTISGSFTLAGLSTLSDLTFDSLMEVGDIRWTGLPALQGLDFATGIVTADRVSITQTGLKSLSGLELTACNALDLNNNPDLAAIAFNDLNNTTDVISITANDPTLAVSLQNLVSSRGITLQDANRVDVSSLESLSGDLSLSQNSFQSFSAPKLTLVVNLIVTNNSLLSSVNFPLLPEITGDLLVANNSRLGGLSFPQLQQIGGNVNITGQFSRIDFPALTGVSGNANVETTINNGTICDSFNQTGGNQVITGTSTCTTGTDPPQAIPDTNEGTSGTNGTNGTNGDGNNSTTNSSDGASNGGGISGAAIGGIVAGVVVLIILAGAGFWWWRRRSNRTPGGAEKLPDATPELPLGGHHEKPELHGSQTFSSYELSNNPMKKSPVHGRSELAWDSQIAEMEGSSVPEMSNDGRR